MSKKSKLYFKMKPLSAGGNSHLKLVTYDDQNKVLNPIYGFGGTVKNNIPQLWEDAEKVEKFSFWNQTNEMNWLIQKWQAVSQSPMVTRGFIADSDYAGEGTGSIYQHFSKVTAAPRTTSFIYMLKIKLENGQYERWRTNGIVNTGTGEVKNDWKSCLRDLQGRYNQWRYRHPEKTRNLSISIVVGDGNTHFENERLAPWLIDFNPSTSEFMRRGRREVIKIHDERTMADAQAVEEMISNL